MTPQQATEAVERGRYVIGAYSNGLAAAEGRAVAYSVGPMVLIETATGECVWWRASLTTAPTTHRPEESPDELHPDH